MLTVEILQTGATTPRGRRILNAMADAHPSDVSVTTTQWYAGRSDWLICFGCGGEDRWPFYRKHVLSGRRAILFDVGYWDRDNTYRLSVDDQHPHRWLYRMPKIPGREHPAELRDDYDANGPVLFAAMGRKSMRQLGSEWDARRVRELLAYRQDVIVRPKPDRKSHPPAGWAPIEQALKGCSLVVAHHSNVAVDGIIAGIPHDVADGVAAALQPTRDPVKRRDFIDRLGSWQWKPSEARECWDFIRSVPEV